jgi:NtrC-family two-component system sensor histidine kinase KinB
VFRAWLARAKDNVTIAGEDRVLASLDSAYAAFLRQAAHPDAAPADPRAGAAYYQATLLPAFLEVRDGAARLRDLNQAAMYGASERAHTVARQVFWSTLLFGLATVGAGLGFSLLLSGRLLQPLRRMIGATQRIAGGDYDVVLPERAGDELGLLAREFNAMATRLQAFRDVNLQEILAEKRKSETILRAIDDGIVVVDAGLRVTSFNPAALRALGAVGEGWPLRDVTADEQLLHRVEAAFAGDRPLRPDERQQFLTLGPAAAPRYYQYALTKVRGSGGTPPLVIVLLRDLTKLRELERLKHAFIMAASHELRTPLTGMEMSIGLLRQRLADRLSGRDRELMDLAADELRRLSTLVNDLLDLSKLESGKIELDFERLPVRPLMMHAASLLAAQARQKEVALTYDAPEDLPHVLADPNKILWVLTNLVSNALRYTDAGGTIRLSAERAGDHLHVSVADTGTGIPPEYQAQIFDKRVQVKDGRPSGGSGLGLAICREIVRAHGGTIWVHSEVGAGSTFTFSLPLDPSGAAART